MSLKSQPRPALDAYQQRIVAALAVGLPVHPDRLNAGIGIAKSSVRHLDRTRAKAVRS